MRQSKKVFFLHLFFAFIFCKSYAQQSPYCGTSEFDIILKTINPNLQKVEDDLNLFQSNFIRSTNFKTSSTVITIPVVFHLVGVLANAKINEAKVTEQLNILNDAYGRIGTYSNGDGVDTRIQFCLATQDPDGYATTGIIPIPTNLHDQYTKTKEDDIDLKNLSHWNPKSYLNIWVCDLADPQLGGYGSFPSYFLGGNSEFRDGVVVSHNFFGVTGHYYYGQGLVLVHEIGHWLNLYHTFMRQKDPNTGLLETPCFNDDCYTNGDYCCDTPPIWSINMPLNNDGPNIGCPTGSNTCHTDSPDLPDLIHNFMDYTNDACKDMFTYDQAKKMQITLSGVRGSLFNSNGCKPGINAANPNPKPDPITVDLGGSITVFSVSGTGGSIDDAVNEYRCKNCIGNSFQINHQPIKDVVYVCETENIIITDGCLDFNLFEQFSDLYCSFLARWTGFCTPVLSYYWNYDIAFYECNDDLTTIIDSEKKLPKFIITTKGTPPTALMYDIRNYAKEARFALTPGKFYRFKIMADYSYKETDNTDHFIGNSRSIDCKKWQENSCYFFIVPDDLAIDGRSLKASQWSGTNKYIGKNTVTISNSSVANGQNVDVVAGNTIRITGNTTISGNFIARINNVDCLTPQNAKWDGENITEISTHDTISKIKLKTMGKDSLLGNTPTFSISPNPSNGNFLIQTGTTEMAHIYIYDVLGNVIYQNSTISAVNIDISTHAKGIYFVKVITGSGTIANEKIVYQ